MKKTILLPILLILAFVASIGINATVISIDNTNFNSNAFIQQLRRNKNTNYSFSSGYTIETDSVRELVMNDTQIEDFKGVELFTKLNYISNQSNTAITNIDLSGCPELYDANFRFCSNLNSINLPTSIERISLDQCDIESFDATKYPNLFALSLINNSRIDTINLTQCKKLRYFSLTNSQINCLNVKNNKNLEFLIASNNKGLKCIDLSNNTKVHSIWYDNCSLSAIDFTQNDSIDYSEEESCSYTCCSHEHNTSANWLAEKGYKDENNFRYNIQAYGYPKDDGEIVLFVHKKELEAALGPDFKLDNLNNWVRPTPAEIAAIDPRTDIFILGSMPANSTGVVTDTATYSYNAKPLSKLSRSIEEPNFNFTYNVDLNNLTTGIAKALGNKEFKAYSTPGTINIISAPGTPISIYTLSGVTVYQGTKHNIAVAPGVYIIKSEQNSYKIYVK